MKGLNLSFGITYVGKVDESKMNVEDGPSPKIMI